MQTKKNPGNFQYKLEISDTNGNFQYKSNVFCLFPNIPYCSVLQNVILVITIYLLHVIYLFINVTDPPLQIALHQNSRQCPGRLASVVAMTTLFSDLTLGCWGHPFENRYD